MLETPWTNHRKNQRSLSFCFAKVLAFSHPLTYQESIDAPRRYANNWKIVSHFIGVLNFMSKKFGNTYTILYFRTNCAVMGDNVQLVWRTMTNPTFVAYLFHQKSSFNPEQMLLWPCIILYLHKKFSLQQKFYQNKCNIAGSDQEISLAMIMNYCQIGILLHTKLSTQQF